MIQVDRLTKSYGPVTAVHDVSFNVEKGEIVGFLGPNGAGKSTTMRILACFMSASSGTVRIAGYDVFRESLKVRKRIGYLPENVPLYGDLRVAPYLDFVAEVKGVGRAERRRRVAEAMERCLITDVQHRLIGRLSKGYRQRVGLAQAILGDPEVLILDEPTIGLDPKQITEIRSLIKSFAGRHTAILSTHILPEASLGCGGAGARRARRDLRARLPAAVEPARAQAGGDDARGGLHPRGGRRAGGRGVEPVRIWPIFKKEMRLYFTSPVAYVVVAIFALIAGYFFYSIFAFFTLASMQSMMNPAMARELNVTDSVMRPLFSNISVILLLLMPLVTMRQFAEERRSGTIELLLTYPVRDGAVLAAKYLAALALYGLMLMLTLLYPGIVVAFARLEWGPVATGYVGLLLMGSTFIAVGLFASSLTENQIVASITTFGILLILWIIGWSADYVGGAWGKVLQHLSILEHNDNFAKGVLDTKDVLYYVNFIALALFLTLRALEARRWKG